MSCNDSRIPAYLHRDGRDNLSEDEFQFDELIYRICPKGNPIEFPAGTITALSSNWSKFIKEQDNFIVNPELGEDVAYTLVDNVYSLKVTKEKNNGGSFPGTHTLSCVLEHDPLECNYSHVVINIKHKCSEFEIVYSYQVWQEGNAILQKKSRFFKELRKSYRSKVISLFNNRVNRIT
jgi:hypothetical protein